MQSDRSYRGLRVLLLEDDVFVRDICGRSLAKMGFEVRAVSDTEEGWRQLEAGGVDLMITDHHMPNATGLELIERARERKLDTPCILISGNMPVVATTAIEKLGRARAMNKPFSIGDLRAVIGELIAPREQT